MDSGLILRYTYAVVVVQFFIGLFGVATNWPIVYITIRNKKLRRLPCYLLGAIAVCDTIYGFGGVVPMITMSFGFQITLRTCFLLESHSPFIISVTIPLILFLGFERLFAVLFPLWYRKYANNRNLTYLCLILVLSVIYAAVHMVYWYTVVLQSPEKLVHCPMKTNKNFNQGQAAAFAYNNQVALTIATIVVYSVTWICIKFKNNDSKTNRLVMKSLMVITLMLFVCWLFTGVFAQINPSLPLGAEHKFLAARIIVQINRLASTLNGPILYFCSAEYRKIFKDEFRNLLCGKGPTTQAHQQTAQNIAATSGMTTNVAPQQRNNQIGPAVQQQNRNIAMISSVNILPRVEN